MLNKIIIGISVFLLTIQLVFAEPQTSETVKFVQLSDTHLSYSQADSSRRLFKDSEALLKDAIKQINNISGVDFVIFTGDMVDNKSEKDLKRFISIANTLKYPWFPVLGNHDVGVGGSFKKKDLVGLLKSTTRGMQAGQAYYTFSPANGLLVIVLDGTTDLKNTAHGFLDDRQLSWLNAQLAANQDKTVVLALHYPVMPPVVSSDHSINEPDRQKLLKIINSYKNIALVISGHYHTTRLGKSGQTVHASNPSLVEYPNAFRVISIYDNGDINFKFVETTLKELQNKSKSRSNWASTSYGKPSDRNNTLNWKK